MASSVSEYFEQEPAPPEIEKIASELKGFLDYQDKSGRRVVIVTSGGTTVPLESHTVRFMDNFSAGTRGSASAEYFLEHGYAVVFMHRQYSLQPYSRHYSHTIDCFLDFMVVTNGDEGETVSVLPQYTQNVKKVLELHNKAKREQRLLKIPFVTVTEYLHILKAAAQLVSPLRRRAMFYLAAAVSDYFIPRKDMEEHKIQSNKGPLVLHLQQVPKMLAPLVKEWAPDAFTVSFKLETDPALVIPKAHSALRRYGHQLVIGNLLTTRKHTVTLVSESSEEAITLSEDEREVMEIETYIVQRLADCHSAFIAAQ